ncbi:radical SAM protein [Candidatus Acetothermia bacterium]|nr:radical SAM protein [Candidatus Acetothermia bacterium]
MKRKISLVTPIVSPFIRPSILAMIIKTRYRPLLRRKLVNLAERSIHRNVIFTPNRPEQINWDRYITARSLLHSVERALQSRNISDHALQSAATVVNAAVSSASTTAREQFAAKYEDGPPGFLVISPTKMCNLNCPGCWAGTEDNPATLEFDLFNRIVREMRELWGAHFVVITGGEPLLYRSEGKDLLDVAEANPESYFMFYTNGTGLTQKVAKRIGKVGNISPAISVEGGIQSTEARRGEGIFGKLLAGFEYLRQEGVFFGIALTATRYNCDEVLIDETIDFYCNKQGAMYAWIFPYTPVGRGYNLDLMMDPVQLRRMHHRLWEAIIQHRILIADFGQSSTACGGCLAAGRPAGQFYINWNGDVAPCAFAPYAGCNIHDIYERGGNLNDLMEIEFFAAIRAWQRSYGYGSPPTAQHNLIRPCLYRDHFGELSKMLERYKPVPLNQEAEAILGDAAYREKLVAYNKECAAVLDPVWQQQYCRPVACEIDAENLVETVHR